MKQILLLLMSCLPLVLTAQQTESEEARKLRYKGYRETKDSLTAAIDREPTAAGKEKIINDFYETPVGKTNTLLSFKSIIQSDLAVAYAAENNVKASNAYLSMIKSPYAKQEKSREAAVAYAKAGNKALAVQMLKPILDSLLMGDGTIKEKDNPRYSYTVQAYVQVLTEGDEQEVIRYLKPMYEISGKYFPADLSSKSGSDFKKQLFYRYAKAFPPQTAAKEIAQIINSAFQFGSVPANLQSAVVKEFANVPNLQKYLVQNDKAAKQQFDSNVQKLFNKTDINGKVWGEKALNGKYILIDFWGSWCLPCRYTHPHLKEVYAKYKDKGFEVIGVARESSTDLEKAKLTWKQAVAQDKINWIQVLANDDLANFDPPKAFGIGVFPTKILLDKNGDEIARYTGTNSDEFDKKMKELFGF